MSTCKGTAAGNEFEAKSGELRHVFLCESVFVDGPWNVMYCVSLRHRESAYIPTCVLTEL